jgi:DNA repair exonuclease SbcCD ATPase subunit
MRLRRLVILGFAQLRGNFALEAPPGSVAFLLADNESGKSTLAAAIRAALYGLEGDRRKSRGKPSELERFRPWTGGPYGVRLELEHDGQEYAIERDFERSSVRVLVGGLDRTQEFQAQGEIQVGQALCGLTRRQFELSCFVGQGDVVFADASELAEALQRVAASEAGAATAARALAVLDDALQQYDGLTLKGKGRVETEIRRCEEEIAAAEAALSQLERERAELSAKLDLLREDGERQESFEQRRDVLRSRRLRGELSELQRTQDECVALAAQVDALAAQVGREADLRELTPERLARLEDARQRWTDERRAAQERAQAAAESERRLRALQDQVAALGLSRRPTEADRETLLRAAQLLQSARLRQIELRVEIEGECAALLERGFDPAHAEQLVARFEALPAADRQRIETRGQTTIALQQRQHELTANASLWRRRRDEIRHAQQARKHFGIWCLIVGMLPWMLAITMYAHLPFSAWYLYGLGAAFFLAGITGLASGQRHGRREDAALRQKLAQQRSELADCEAEQAAAEATWQQLAERLGLAPDSLEAQHRDWQNVDRSVDTIRRLRERMKLVDAQLQDAGAAMLPIAELLQREANLESLESWRTEVGAALDLYRERDAADVQARDAQRRAEESAQQVGQRELELGEQLRAMQLELAAGEDLISALASIPARAEAARAARDRALQQLPERQRQLAALPNPHDLARRIAVAREELERCERRLLQRSARGFEFDADAVQPDRPLPPQEFDRSLTRLDEEERRARSADEADRHAAQHFLIRYEGEAPALREKLELHRAARDRAVSFAAAIRLAHATLERVAHQTHRDWSTALNAELARMLTGLGSEVEDALLDDKLRLRLSRSGKLLAGEETAQQLSVGAVERIYLALRIALSRVLARDGLSLPLILDDPFANADDRRLVQGLSLLIDAIAPTQQVMLLACQGSRYTWVRHRLPRPERLLTLTLQQLSNADREGAQG